MALRARARLAPQRATPNAIADLAWFAREDAPVRVATAAVPLVDGRAAMLALCAAFLTAKQTIWLAGRDLHGFLEMVRGRDQRAGPDGSPEQGALLRRLRTAINRSGDHMVQVVEEVDEMAGRRETAHVVYAVGNLVTGQFERLHSSRRGVRDVEEFLRTSDTRPRMDDLDGDACVAVD